MYGGLIRKIRIRILAALVFVIIFSVGALYLFSKTVRPKIIAITQSYAKNKVSEVVDDEVKKVMLEEFFRYEDIVFINRDKEGRVTSVSSNATLINKFTNDLGINIGNALDRYSTVKNKIHLSSLVGSDLFAGIGPKIPVRFTPVSVTNADITHSFEEAGINQTLHTINLTVSVEMAVVMPFAYSTVLVESTMPIAQTLIVGVVPDTYLYKK